MDNNLPAFARALQRRRMNQTYNTSQRRKPVENDSFSSDNLTNSPPRNSAQTIDPQYIKYKQTKDDEVQALKDKIADLEQEISILSTEKLKIQKDLDTERQVSESLSKQIDEIREELESEKTKNEILKEQVSQLESFMDNKQQLSDAKETVIQRIQLEYQEVMKDYQNLLATNSTQASQLRQARQYINELEQEIEYLNKSNRRSQSNNNVNLPQDDFDYWSKPDKEFNTSKQELSFETSQKNNAFYETPKKRDNFDTNYRDELQQSRRPRVVKSALVDNIVFG
ncbi:hypothetical protein GPJ56_007793 [Histomonas meleagridis]|uniref:uncharacterized protein n=1 Tax=Histomonas meleagridis TaxID=135588 RepID=UPI00355ACD8F|nr:hypothetical protein GPJ56_007793 [Histomonas meleagridis]KAH0798728.1 hypothetical protein GO595_008593 [Histomonas meleagridis]